MLVEIENKESYLIPPDDWNRVMGDVERRVHAYTGGSFMWCARQEIGGQWSNQYAVAFRSIPGKDDGGSFCVDLDRARNADEALILELAADVLGFPVGSEQDLLRHKKVAEAGILEASGIIGKAEAQLAYHRRKLDEVNAKLTAITK